MSYKKNRKLEKNMAKFAGVGIIGYYKLLVWRAANFLTGYFADYARDNKKPVTTFLINKKAASKLAALS